MLTEAAHRVFKSNLANINEKNDVYNEVMRMIYASMDPHLAHIALSYPQISYIAADVFFAFFSTTPRVDDRENPDQLMEIARAYMLINWRTIERARAELGTELNYALSLALAKEFLDRLLRQLAYSSAGSAHVILRRALGDALASAIERVKRPQHPKARRRRTFAGPAASKYSEHHGMNSSYDLWQEHYALFKFKLRELLAEKDIASVSSSMGTEITGYLTTSALTKARHTDFVHEELALLKLASGTLIRRQYSTFNLSVVIAVDASSSTGAYGKYTVPSNFIRPLAYFVHNLVHEMNVRHSLFVFDAKPFKLINCEDVYDVLRRLDSNGGTDIDTALKYADELAENLGGDAVNVLITDCEDSVSYTPRHKVVSIVVNSKSRIAQLVECVEKLSKSGPLIAVDPYRDSAIEALEKTCRLFNKVF